MNLLFMGLAGSVLIIVTLLIRFFAVHKLPRWVFLVFWYVALTRLLVPYSLPSSFNAFDLLNSLFSKTQPSSEMVDFENMVTAVTSTTISDMLPITIKPGDATLAEEGIREIAYATAPPAPDGLQGSVSSVVEHTTTVPGASDVVAEGSVTALFPDNESVFSSLANAFQATMDIWLPIWVIGSIVCVAVFAFAYWRSHRKFRESLPVNDAFVAEWVSKQRIRRRLQVRSSDQISTPVCYGIIKPVILLPKHFDWEDREGLLYVLTHEYMHIRHFDSVTKLLIIAAVCLYWFNPLVWALYILANRDIEFATDAAVVRTCGTTTRSQYALTLISMAEAKSSLAPLCNHFSRNVIEERITAIMTMKKTPWVSVALSAVLLTGTTTAFATTPQVQLLADDVSASDVSAEPLLTEDSGAVAYKVIEDEDGKVVVTLKDGETAEVTEGGMFSTTTTAEDATVNMATAYLDKELVWWTADEYEAWLNQEKEDLQECLGAKAWTSSKGWFTWTQDMIDEAIADYEDVLEEIKAGAKVSKPFALAVSEDGVVTSDVAIQTVPTSEAIEEGPLVDYTFTATELGEATEATATDGAIHLDYVAESKPSEASLVAAYETDAVETSAVELQADEAAVSEALTESTQTVSTTEIVSDGDGATYDASNSIDVSAPALLADDAVAYTVKESDGVMTVKSNDVTYATALNVAEADDLTEEEIIALRAQEKAQQIFGEDDVLAVDSSSSDTPRYFKKFEPFDLDVQRVDGGYDIYYKSGLVKAFIDDRPDGSYFSLGSKTQGGEVVVHAVYDENGKLAGLEEVEVQ